MRRVGGRPVIPTRLDSWLAEPREARMRCPLRHVSPLLPA